MLVGNPISLDVNLMQMKHGMVLCADGCTDSTAVLEAAGYSKHYDSLLRPQVDTRQNLEPVSVSAWLFLVLYKPQP